MVGVVGVETRATQVGGPGAVRLAPLRAIPLGPSYGLRSLEGQPRLPRVVKLRREVANPIEGPGAWSYLHLCSSG